MDLTDNKKQDLPEQLDKLLENVETEQLEIVQWLLNNPDYEEKPVEIEEFILSPYYLNLRKTIRPRVLAELKKIFSHKEGKTWLQSPTYNEFIFIAGIGSGKSFASSVSLSYLTYQLGCLKDPVAYFKFSPGSKLYLMNMCLTGETELFLRNGKRVTLEELYKKRGLKLPYIFSLNNHGHLVPKRIKKIVRTGYKKVYQVKTKDNITIKATDNHPFLTKDGYVVLKNLKVGDKVVVGGNFHLEGNIKMSEDEIKLIAYLIGDGCTKNYISFANSNKNALDEFRGLCNKFREVKKNDKTIEIYPSRKDKIYDIVRKFDLWGKTSLDKRIPSQIFQLSENDRKLFLSRLWTTDGSIYYSSYPRCTYSTSSYNLAKDVYFLLRSLGIISSIRTRKTTYGFTKNKKNTNDGYQVCILQGKSVKKFFDEIGKFGFNHNHLYNKLNNNGYRIHNKYLIPIKEIKYIGKEYVYDLEIEPYHNFMANGFIVHNSTSSPHAKNVVFGEIKARIDNCQWFKNRFPYDPQVQSELHFPKGINIIPGNSSETFFEGYNIFGGVLDEADSHTRVLEKGTVLKDFAEIGYDAIKGRIKSRFGQRGLLIVIGSPKTVDGFLMTKYRESAKIKKTYRTIVRTWESPPLDMKFSGKTFTIKGIEIPIEYKPDFDRNPEKSLRDLAAEPSYATEPFFHYPEKVENGFNDTRHSPWNEISKRFKKEFRGDDGTPRWVHIDLGVKKDATGIAMGHVSGYTEFEGEKLPIIYMDLMLRISVPKGNEISIADIRQMIYNLIERKFNIIGVTFDGFQSIESIQQLTKRGIRADYFSVDKDTKAYDSLKEAIYQSRLDYYKYEPFITECVHLELLNGEKVDHQPNGSKDVSDAVAGVVYNLMSSKKAMHGVTRFVSLLGSDSRRVGAYQLDNMERKVKKHNKTNKPLRRFYGI